MKLYEKLEAYLGFEPDIIHKVTKTNIHKFLMFLAFEKEKYELEERLIKRKK